MSAFSRQLIHSCTTQRAITTQQGTGEKVPTYTDWLTGQACRYVVKQESFADELKGLQTKVTYLLLLEAGVDVRQSDRVVNVVVEDDEVEPGPFKILAVIPRRGAKGQHHIKLDLERVK